MVQLIDSLPQHRATAGPQDILLGQESTFLLLLPPTQHSLAYSFLPISPRLGLCLFLALPSSLLPLFPELESPVSLRNV